MTPISLQLRSLRAVAPIVLVLAAPLAAQEPPLTTAEASGFTATSRHTDIMSFIAALQRLSPNIRVETMAVSTEGRPLPLIVLGNPLPTSPAALRDDDRLVVYFQADIHAGEVEGKEAAQMLTRDILLGRTRDYLDSLVILIAPVFNPDGNERISPENRTNQHGPAQGVGERYNGLNLDLNRDGLKLETPEVRGLVRNVFLRWDPAFFLDSHTHNGSYHQEPVTWVWGLNPNGDGAILDYMSEVMLPDITTRMRDDYSTLSVPHGDFIDVRDPAKGWVPLGPQPRYLSNYMGLRNRFSILNEQYPYVDFETRVQGAYDMFLSFLDHLFEHKQDVRDLIREADRRAVLRGSQPTEHGDFIVEYGNEPIGERLTIRGWDMELVPRDNGRPRVRVTDRERVWENVPYFARFTSERSVSFPLGYLITVRDKPVLDVLLGHGLAVERLTAPTTLTVERFTVTGVTPSRRLNQGHFTSTVEGTYDSIDREFPVGTYFVSTAQPLSAVAAYLLEPESDDGLVLWNRFDRYIGTQFGNAPQTYPVYRLMERVHFATERVADKR